MVRITHHLLMRPLPGGRKLDSGVALGRRRSTSGFQEQRVADAKAVTPGAQLDELLAMMANERILGQTRKLCAFGERNDPLKLKLGAEWAAGRGWWQEA
jgi:hypothetical protein